MKNFTVLIISVWLLVTTTSCKKGKEPIGCLPGATTVRQIVDKSATIQLTATVNPVWIIEDGTIDTRLIPCDFPLEFYHNGLKVLISGDVKTRPQIDGEPCCSENFVITKITRQ